MKEYIVKNAFGVVKFENKLDAVLFAKLWNSKVEEAQNAN